MRRLRADKIIDDFTKEGISQGFSGRPLKRFVTRNIKKCIKLAKEKCDRIENVGR